MPKKEAEKKITVNLSDELIRLIEETMTPNETFNEHLLHLLMIGLKTEYTFEGLTPCQ